jgi:hypothetical protein
LVSKGEKSPILLSIAEIQNVSQMGKTKQQSNHLIFSYWIWPGFEKDFIIFMWQTALANFALKYAVFI